MNIMNKLSDFKPFQRVTLPGLGRLECSGLILIVGPNSSGKTQLLQDLYRTISGEPRTLVVAERVQIHRPEPWDSFLECLEREGYLRKFTDDAGVVNLHPRTSFVGTGQAAPQIQVSQARQLWDSYRPDEGGKTHRRSEFLVYFGRFLATILLLDRRLIAVQQVPLFDYESQPPQNELQALYIRLYRK